MIPTFCGFLLAPILDVRFSRRSYALVFGVLTAIAVWIGLVSISAPGIWRRGSSPGFLFANMFYNALGELAWRSRWFPQEMRDGWEQASQLAISGAGPSGSARSCSSA